MGPKSKMNWGFETEPQKGFAKENYLLQKLLLLTRQVKRTP